MKFDRPFDFSGFVFHNLPENNAERKFFSRPPTLFSTMYIRWSTNDVKKKKKEKSDGVFRIPSMIFLASKERKNYNDVIKFRKRELLTLVNPWLELFRGVGIQKLRPSQGESKLLDISKYNLLPSGKTTSGLVSCRAHDKGQKLFKSQTDFVPAPLEQPPRGCPAQL